MPLTFPLLGDRYQGRDRPDRLLWHDLASRTFGVDTLSCSRCGFPPLRVLAVVTSPTREQLEAIRRPGASFTVLPERSRAPPAGQLRLPFMRRAA